MTQLIRELQNVEYLENICYLHLNILGMTCIPTKGINTHDPPIFDI